MPAIPIDRLKAQIQSILGPKLPPQIFLESLRSLMEAHANLAFRPSPKLLQSQGLDSYQLSPVLHNQLRLHLVQFAKSNPDLALSYADALWNEPTMEMKKIAGILMSALPDEKIPEILDRVIKWSMQSKDKSLRGIIFTDCIKTIREHGLSYWEEVIRNWIESKNSQMIVTALQAQQILVQDPKFENTPFVFNCISSIADLHNDKISNALNELLQALILRLPHETAYFIKSLLINQPSPELNRIVRRNLEFFPEDQQAKIRQILKS
jgi:hypothetical protein